MSCGILQTGMQNLAKFSVENCEPETSTSANGKTSKHKKLNS